MANDWNPNRPVALGDEWLATVASWDAVAPSFWCGIQRLRSSVAETIATLRMRIDCNPSVTNPLYTVCDIMPAGSERPGPIETAYLLPNADISIGGPAPEGWVSSALGTTNLWSFIDDLPVELPIDSDSISVRSSATTTASYTCHVNAAPIPAGARILNVSIVAVDSVIGTINPTFVFYGLQRGGTLYTPPNSIFATHIYGNQRIVDCGEINPFTLRPWIPADIADFNGGLWRIRIDGNTANGGQSRTAVFKLALRVTYITTENRVAIGTWQRPGGLSPGDVDLPVVSMPSGAANWAKPASGVFSYLWRSAYAPIPHGNSQIAGDVNWRYLYQALSGAGTTPGFSPPPVPDMRGGRVMVDQYGIPTEDVDPDGVVAHAIALRTSAPATSNDSQPYFIAGLAEVAPLTSATANGIAQRIRAFPSGGTYLGLRFIVSPPATGGGPLTVTITRVSDGMQMGGSFVLTADQARALPDMPGNDGFKFVEGVLDAPANLVVGPQYEIRFTTTTTAPWVFLVPRCIGGAGSASYGGTADGFRFGAAFHSDQDMPAVVLIQPDPVANARAQVVTEQLDPGTMCGAEAIDQNLIEWDPYSELGAAFDYYEIQRLDPDGEWHSIRQVGPESRTSATDYEAPRGIAVRYRIRVIATTHAFSEWAETGFVTAQAYGCDVVLTSNVDPSLTLAYTTEPGVDFDFLDHDGDTPVRIAGRPYQVVFVDPEEKGLGETLRLVVNFGEQPTDPLGRPIGRRAVFAPLRALIRAVGNTIPYVAVLDPYGNVTYAHITLGRGREDQPAWRYQVNAVLTPLTDTPAVAET